MRVTVTLRCDAERAPDCHREYATEGDRVPATVFAVMREAASVGWKQERPPGQLVSQDVCPACSAAASPPLA